MEAQVLWLAIAILAIVTLVCVVLLILHRRKRRQEERHRERMRQEAVLRLIEQVEATDDDTVLDELYSEFLFSYELTLTAGSVPSRRLRVRARA